MVIQYCDSCGMRVSDDDLQSGTALQGEENRVWCPRCAPSQFVQGDGRKGRSSKIMKAVARPSERRIKPVTPDSNKSMPSVHGATTATAPTVSPPSSRSTTAANAATRTTSTSTHTPSSRSTSNQPPKSNTIIIAAVMTAIILIGALMLASGGSTTTIKPIETPGAMRTDERPRNNPDSALASNDRQPTRTSTEPARQPEPSHNPDSTAPAEKPALPVENHSVDTELSDMRNSIAAKKLDELKTFLAANPDAYLDARDKASDLLGSYRSTPAGEETARLMAAIKIPAGTATFIRSDLTTAGTWKGIYGKDGYMLASVDARKLPAHVKFPTINNRFVNWRSNTNDDLRTLQKPGDNTRFAACWANPSYTFDMQTSDKGERVELYFLDWDKKARIEMLEVLDGNETVIDKRDLTEFSNGVYLVYDVTGLVRFRIKGKSGINAVLSAFFFDPPGVDAPVGSAPVQALSTTTPPASGTPGTPVAPANPAAPATAEKTDPKALEEASYEYERVLLLSYASLKTGDTQGSLQVLEKAKADPRLAPLLPKLAADMDMVPFLEDINTAALAMLPGLAQKGLVTLEKVDGDKVQIGGATKNKIVEIKNRTIQMEQTVGGGKVSVGLDFDSLSLPTRLDLAGSAVSDLKSAYGWYVAVQCGASDMSAKALRQRLDAARKTDAASPLLEHLAGRVTVYEKEQGAETAFRGLDPMLREKRWADAETFLDNFTKEFAGTRALQRLKPIIEQRTTEIDAALHPPKPGLWTSYWSTDQRTNALKTMLTAHAENTSVFNYGTNGPDPAVPADYFGVKMAGYVRIDKDATFSFKLKADDKVTLYIDGKEVAATPGVSAEKNIDIPMTKGEHAIKIVYYEINGGAHFSVTWKVPGAKAYTALAGGAFYDERYIEKYQKD